MHGPQLGYIIAYVADVGATLAFYERAFGLTTRFMHPAGDYAELATGATTLAFAHEQNDSVAHLLEPNRAEKRAAAIEIAFVVHDVAAAVERALGAGASPVLAPTAKPWGQTVAYVRDLNGLLIELCTPVEPVA